VVAVSEPLIEWGVASRALQGQAASGDRHLVKTFGGRALLAVVDGVGHGEEAASAAEAGIAALEARPDEPIIALLRRCHQRLKGTRGAAASLALVDGHDETMTWAGIGNVEGVLWRADATARPRQEYIPLRGGMLGSQMTSASATVVRLLPGDLIAFATDGVREGFSPLLAARDPPERIARRILDQHASGMDDALILVVRFLGGRA
jgi:negative regulator of sigma-B (phosphoserine phosphatase)